MILQALADYYVRKTAHQQGVLPPFGFERKTISAVIEIDSCGDFIQLIRRDAKEDSAEEWVPSSVKRTVKIQANLLWDNVEYALGFDTNEDEPRPDRVKKQHEAFLERIQAFPVEDEGLAALKVFLGKLPSALNENITSEQLEFLHTNPNISFRLSGEPHLICQRPKFKSFLSESRHSSGNQMRCLISGDQDDVERLHPAIKGVWGAQTSGANIVSFNCDAFESFGKKRGLNAPVGSKSSFVYTTALNYLLRRDSRQCIQVGDATTVFWAEQQTETEENFSIIFGSTPKQIKDDPDRYTTAVEAVFSSVERGRYQDDKRDLRFYVLGLSPNAARASIRFWHIDTVANISKRIAQHFDNLNIVHDPNEPPYLPLFILLVNIAMQGKSENIPPNLSGEIMRSILTGQPYPQTLLAAAVRRCKAEQKIDYPRSAIIKACINRSLKEEDLKMSLDTANINPAYLLGRLFAVLEKIQKEAMPGTNTTIRESYYGTASSNPVSVFPRLLKLKNHHLNKLSSAGRKSNFEEILGGIIEGLPADMPSSLDLQDQGRFAVGYYHQRQFFQTF